MTDPVPPGPLLSVRAQARITVDSDSVTLACALRLSGASRAGALLAAAAELASLTDDLATLGGVALTSTTARAPLTWSAQSAGTQIDEVYDKDAQTTVPTGLVTATVSVLITARSFDLLEDLGRLLAGHEALGVHSTSWEVDADNPAWATVRAQAIRAAIAKGHDYATALGTSIERVEHIADSGLLEGDHSRSPQVARALHGFAGSAPDSPALDPVPQELTATIEARFIAAPVAVLPLR